MMHFPDNCIKGIPNKTYLLDDGRVGSHLFYFEMRHARDDGWVEQSINWEDNDLVIEFTLNQRKENGTIQFKAGIAIIPRGELDRLKGLPTVNGILSYERQKLQDNNPYHGNLLLQANVSKHIMKMIAAAIALVVLKIVPQNRD